MTISKGSGSTISRRGLFQSSAAILGGAVLGKDAKGDQEAQVRNVNTNSSPSTLKITDLRVVTMGGRHIIRLYTNQDVYGLGEVRDGASATYALFLKSRLVGENPLRINYLFQKIKQFGGHGRQAGGVVAVEVALWDIVGKVYGCLLYTSPSPRDGLLSRMPSSA